MCGHAVIALGRFAVDRGLVAAREPETAVRIQCPCGPVEARVEVAGRPGRARSGSRACPPSCWPATPSCSPRLRAGDARHRLWRRLLRRAAGGRARARPAARARSHGSSTRPWRSRRRRRRNWRSLIPTEPDLGFLYGIIFTDEAEDPRRRSTANICVFADGQVDRSPTGSGVTARLALMHRAGQIAPGQARRFKASPGPSSPAACSATTTVGPHPAVIVEVARRSVLHRRGQLPARARRPARRGLPAAPLRTRLAGWAAGRFPLQRRQPLAAGEPTCSTIFQRGQRGQSTRSTPRRDALPEDVIWLDMREPTPEEIDVRARAPSASSCRRARRCARSRPRPGSTRRAGRCS